MTPFPSLSVNIFGGALSALLLLSRPAREDSLHHKKAERRRDDFFLLFLEERTHFSCTAAMLSCLFIIFRGPLV